MTLWEREEPCFPSRSLVNLINDERRKSLFFRHEQIRFENGNYVRPHLIFFSPINQFPSSRFQPVFSMANMLLSKVMGRNITPQFIWWGRWIPLTSHIENLVWRIIWNRNPDDPFHVWNRMTWMKNPINHLITSKGDKQHFKVCAQKRVRVNDLFLRKDEI